MNVLGRPLFFDPDSSFYERISKLYEHIEITGCLRSHSQVAPDIASNAPDWDRESDGRGVDLHIPPGDREDPPRSRQGKTTARGFDLPA